jgi:hypothetical protein
MLDHVERGRGGSAVDQFESDGFEGTLAQVDAPDARGFRHVNDP